LRLSGVLIYKFEFSEGRQLQQGVDEICILKEVVEDSKCSAMCERLFVKYSLNSLRS